MTYNQVSDAFKTYIYWAMLVAYTENLELKRVYNNRAKFYYKLYEEGKISYYNRFNETYIRKA